MRNKIEDLRNHLFDCIERLMDEENPMDIKTAETVALVADKIIESAKVEVQAMRLLGKDGSGFLEPEPKKINP